MKEKCHIHIETDALSLCHSCGRYFCSECLTEGPQYYYCKEDKCQKSCQEEIEVYESRPRGTGFLKNVFSKKNLLVGWSCWWQAMPITVAGSILLSMLIFIFIRVLAPLFNPSLHNLPDILSGLREEYGKEVSVDTLPYVTTASFLLVGTLSFNWSGKRAIKKYWGITTQKFSCKSVFILLILFFCIASLIIGVPFGILVLAINLSKLILLPWLLFVLFLSLYFNGYIITRIADGYKNEDR